LVVEVPSVRLGVPENQIITAAKMPNLQVQTWTIHDNNGSEIDDYRRRSDVPDQFGGSPPGDTAHGAADSRGVKRETKGGKRMSAVDKPSKDELCFLLERYDNICAEFICKLRAESEKVAELLAACEALLPEDWRDGTMDHMPGVAIARAAIAKANGEPQ
jgi:hypothetical protein